MKIAIGCDHGALNLKNKLVSHLEGNGYEVTDFGTYTNASCDYPEFAAAAARAVASGECEKGIVLCTTGIGVSISANKIDGIRCALLSDVWSAKMTRLHNDTNMMAIGAGESSAAPHGPQCRDLQPRSHPHRSAGSPSGSYSRSRSIPV